MNRELADEIRASFSNLSEQRKILIDCSFDVVMDSAEQSSLAIQLQESYSHLRRYGMGGAQMFLTDVNENLRSTLDKKGASRWAVHIHSGALKGVVQDLAVQTIYLSPDAVEELTCSEIQDASIAFVIGGIVDKKVSRNETSHKATKMLMRCRRLPTDPTRLRNKIFNVDTVFKFLLQAMFTGISTRDELIRLLEETIPDRKIVPQCTSSTKITLNNPLSTCGRVTAGKGNTLKLNRYSIVELFQYTTLRTAYRTSL